MSNNIKSNFGGLKNNELIFISFIMQDVLAQYNEIISQKGITNKLSLPDGSFLETFKTLDEAEVKEILASKRYSYVKSINTKLSSVSALIQDSFPDVYEEIKEMFTDDKESTDFLL